MDKGALLWADIYRSMVIYVTDLRRMPKNGLQFKNDDLMKVLLRNDKAALSYANSHLYAYSKITNKRPNEQNLFILSHYFRLNMRKLKDLSTDAMLEFMEGMEPYSRFPKASRCVRAHWHMSLSPEPRISSPTNKITLQARLSPTSQAATRAQRVPTSTKSAK